MHLKSSRQQLTSNGDVIELAYVSYKECKTPEWWEGKLYQVWYILEVPVDLDATLERAILNVFSVRCLMRLEEGKWLVSEFLTDPPRKPTRLARSRARDILYRWDQLIQQDFYDAMDNYSDGEIKAESLIREFEEKIDNALRPDWF